MKEQESNRHSEKTVVEKQALERLSKVESDHQKAYDKKKSHLHIRQIIMVIVLIIIVWMMLFH